MGRQRERRRRIDRGSFFGFLSELEREKYEKKENLYFLTPCFSFLSLQLCINI